MTTMLEIMEDEVRVHATHVLAGLSKIPLPFPRAASAARRILGTVKEMRSYE
jgi:hypothetical protein